MVVAAATIPIVAVITLVAEPTAEQADLLRRAQALIEQFKDLADDPRYAEGLTEEDLLICIERLEAIRTMFKGPTVRRFEEQLERSVPEIVRDYRVTKVAAIKVLSDLITEGEDRIDRMRSQAGLDEAGFRSMDEVFASLPRRP